MQCSCSKGMTGKHCGQHGSVSAFHPAAVLFKILNCTKHNACNFDRIAVFEETVSECI